MKKLRSFLLSLAMIFVVVLSTACSSKEATATKTFVKEQNGVKVTLVYTYIESEDKVVKQTSKTEALFSAFKGRDIEQVKKQLQDISAKFQGIKGIKETVDIQEDKFIEEVEVDYSELDYEKAKNLPGMIFSGDPTKTKVSMEKSEKMLMTHGFEEQK
ncbi:MULTISPECIES: YehR family protein [unclassified Parvimonas]|uniref:YehR family lipoprotein n=1 Tax=unclassified Parvimonas TaxID=1151464 RepID=UPI002B484ABC|nr:MULTISPECIES: YehR family protein [unclassified Parvimonas]MEB3024835.1 YehR family protein [Parvimonas sp. M13]MEB3073029.1 YehR family protein [Parvimonas sp. C2]MEB3089017.1 YehR family protein [Parvimonas sp. M20]